MYAALWKINATAFQIDQTNTKLYHFEIMKHLFHHRPTIMLSMPKICRDRAFPLAALLRATCVGSINLKRHGPHNLEATKPEDKIFALLGLAADREELKNFGVVPNYDVPYEQTYTTTMVALLRQGHISLLSMCQASRSPNLPSWVPDWSRSVTDMLQDVRNDHMTLYPEFNSSGGHTNQNSITIVKEAGIAKHISVKSILFDEIIQVGRFPNRIHSKGIPLSETYTWTSEWLVEILRLSYCCTKKRYKRFRDRLSDSAQTATGDIVRNSEVEPTRAGNAHFDDAVILLRDGLQLFGNGRLKVEAERFLATQTITTKFTDRIKSELRLAFQIMGTSLGRLPFVTKKEHLGLSSDDVRQGDVIAIIEGSQVPFVLRPLDKGRFSLVSEAYVNGIMDGEATETSEFSYITLV
ncbi:hypothetical protein BM1_03406 [Bipolaris maydis]|nr:hypothetical protein BM1_03406 [Bipolaris maydis]